MAQNSEINDVETIQPEQADIPQTAELVDIGTASKDKKVMDINQQMDKLETNLDALNKKINSTNRQIKKEVKRLDGSDLELTEKIADTYKQLGQIETTFETLGKQSKKLSSDLKSVSSSLSEVETGLRQSIDDLDEEQQVINTRLQQEHEQLAERATDLSKKVSSLSSKLTKSINSNSKLLQDLEARMVAELEKLAADSEQRDKSLENKLDATQQEVNSQQAKMLLMQSVDAALDKRATSLEQTSERLLSETESLRSETEALDVLTARLVADLESLELVQAEFRERQLLQQQQIESLQAETGSLGRTLLSLANLEKRHFRFALVSIVLLAIIITASYFHSQYQRDTDQSVISHNDALMQQQVTGLQSRVATEQAATQVFNDEIIALKQDINTLQANLDQKTDELENSVKQINQAVDSIDGRIRYLAPLYNFGSDNVIHGSDWLAKLDPQKWSIKIGTVSDQKELYDFAMRYNRYFTEDLGYVKSTQEPQQFTLFYGGQFEDETAVNAALRRLPGQMNFQRLQAISNEQVLQLAQ